MLLSPFSLHFPHALQMGAALAAARAESAGLQERLSQFVRGNIDSMLAYRQLREAAAHAEGATLAEL